MSVFVFDGDDTFWMNEWQYSQATADFFSYLYSILGSKTPNLHYVRDRYYSIDGELFKEWGIKRGRVAEGMVLTYRDICKWVEWRFEENVYKKEHEDRIRKIGDQPFDFTKLQWLPYVKDVLSVLKSSGHILCFLSSYDKTLFPHKADFLGLNEFFIPDKMRLTEVKKTKEDFIAVSGWLKENDCLQNWYAVGNGESDIRPALEISDNWRGIYIPHGSTSKYFQEGGQVNYFMPPRLDHPRVVTIRSMEELLSVI